MDSHQNHLIERLPRADRLRLLAICEPVELPLSEILCTRGEPTRYAYFPTDSFISLISTSPSDSGLEVGMVGSEGMLGTQLTLGVLTSPLQAMVQGQGAAWRIKAKAFMKEHARSSALQRCMKRYVYVTMDQLAASALCLHFHQISQRLARWLLMSQDRAHASRFHVTHEFLAFMLGVRRVGVTTAAGDLQRQGLIQYHRGEITVTDRAGLEAVACSCYMANQLVYEQLL